MHCALVKALTQAAVINNKLGYLARSVPDGFHPIQPVLQASKEKSTQLSVLVIIFKEGKWYMCVREEHLGCLQFIHAVSKMKTGN